MAEDTFGGDENEGEGPPVRRRGPPEKLWEVEWRFWEQLRCEGIERASRGQMADLFRRLLPRLRKHAEAETLDPEQYEALVDEAKLVVEDVATALNARVVAPEAEVIWSNPGIRDIGRESKAWVDVSPVDSDDLSAVLVRYLERPWMQSNTIEWYILRGFVFDTASRFEKNLLSGAAAGFINWAYIFAGGDLEKTLYWRAGLTMAAFVGRWLLAPAVAAALFFAGREELALWAGGIAALWLAWSVVTLPGRWLRERALRREMEAGARYVKRLSWLYISLSNLVWSPAEMLEKARQAVGEDLYMPPPVMSMLRRAAERDPSIFIALPNERPAED